jgi:hypothetical protein
MRWEHRGDGRERVRWKEGKKERLGGSGREKKGGGRKGKRVRERERGRRIIVGEMDGRKSLGGGGGKTTWITRMLDYSELTQRDCLLIREDRFNYINLDGFLVFAEFFS